MSVPRPTRVSDEQPRPIPVGVLLRDDFDRPDSASIGNGWTDGSTFAPHTYAPLGVRDRQVYCSDPLAPAGRERAIGCCWRDLGTVDVQATIVVPPQSTHFREATPLLHVTPGTPTHGFGAWLSTFHGKSHLGFLLVGTIGNPIEDFHAVATATYTRDDRPHVLTIRSEGGRVTVYYDGLQLVMADHPGGAALPEINVPSELRRSTMHGLAVDCHLEPDEASMRQPVIVDSWFEAVT